MATYLKRTSKLFDISLSRPTAEISLRDLICPVCRSILIEPVTLPCTHNLCLRCLKGTFEHNSLSCPLCRIRVGSWLRTATKTETLVNNGLWEIIQTKFPKEIEDKYNGDDRDIELGPDFSTTNKILSVAGEIRREYEVQLQMAEEEIRSQRKAEEMASEALIRKIREEEQQHQLAQLAQDQLLAKSLAKKQITEKHKEVCNYYNDLPTASNSSFQTSKFNIAAMSEVNPCRTESHNAECEQEAPSNYQDGSGLRRSNIALISKHRAERYVSSVKSDLPSECNDTMTKFCCQKSVPVYNTIARTLKHQVKMLEPHASNCTVEPGTSLSKIYGTQSKEELHVPSDVVNSKKKSLGVEVCTTLGDDDERMGSAESAGSHDSINQEIHHFKPIKAMPRTPLKISSDGRQIDPKLIRVVPILKRISNVIPKPPSQAHLKRIIGCSWSAFRGKTRQTPKEKEAYKESMEGVEQKPSTSYNQPQIISSKMTKSQTHDSIRKLNFDSQISFDSNKNYAKSVNKIINGTKVSKRLTLDEHMNIEKLQKSWKPHVRNGMVCKSKRQRNLWVKKDARTAAAAKYVDETETRDSTSSSASIKMSSPCDDVFEMQTEDTVMTENIAERIKKRKTDAGKRATNRISSLNSESEIIVKRSSRKRLFKKQDLEFKITDDVPIAIQKKNRVKLTGVALAKSKQRRVCRAKQSSTESSEKSDASVSLRRPTRKLRHKNSSSINSEQNMYEVEDSNNYNSSESCNEMQECISENNNTTDLEASREKGVLSDEEIIKEQERMERLVIQEKEDFELAQRLQAKFDEMERIAGRTRRSRKAFENETIELDLYKLSVGKNVQKADSHTAKSSVLSHTVNTEVKKRGRPPKRVK
ncbi:uncharacterized protein LOC143186955 [Calliopsis andreniformis]|uniref:uncharacterized protein LOC143186955 n=1 Tax=Calliopsis andreniformis TaxID=337506 RepID=UPI003FCD0DF0